MKLRHLSFVSLARSSVMTLPAPAGHDVTLLDLCFRDDADMALTDDARGARPQGIGALFAQLRVGTTLAKTRP
jgi:hypothetical protein